MVARTVDPSLKVTAPAGVPPPGATVLTVALSVPDEPDGAGFLVLVKVTVVDALTIVWVIAPSLAS